jgi:hypothetical protein
MSGLRRILLTAFCQTPGLASALRLLFPQAEIYTRSALAKKDAAAADVAHLLGQLDAWISVEGGDDFFSGSAYAQSHPNLRYLRIPLIEFPAFHPDVCTAARVVGGPPVKVKHTSVLAAWAYRAQMPPADAARLFNKETFANLGYLTNWDESVGRMQAAFAASDLADDFDRFYLSIKRLGLFMYSDTHPRPEVIAALAKLIALKLGRDEASLNLDVPAYDALSYFLWPVYPEIARNLSVPTTGYVWQLTDSERIEGLENFLKYSYDQYRAKGLAPEHIGVAGIDMDQVGRAVVSGP